MSPRRYRTIRTSPMSPMAAIQSGLRGFGRCFPGALLVALLTIVPGLAIGELFGTGSEILRGSLGIKGGNFGAGTQFLFSLIGTIISMLGTAAIAYGVCQGIKGARLGAGQMLARALACLWPLVIVAILMAFILSIAALPGIMGATIFVTGIGFSQGAKTMSGLFMICIGAALFLGASATYAVATISVLEERKTGSEALKRSANLTRNNRTRVALAILPPLLLKGAIFLIPFVLGASITTRAQSEAEMDAELEGLIQSLVIPLALIALVASILSGIIAAGVHQELVRLSDDDLSSTDLEKVFR